MCVLFLTQSGRKVGWLHSWPGDWEASVVTVDSKWAQETGETGMLSLFQTQREDVATSPCLALLLGEVMLLSSLFSI